MNTFQSDVNMIHNEYHYSNHLLSSRLYCRLRNSTESCLAARGLYHRWGLSPRPEDLLFNLFDNTTFNRLCKGYILKQYHLSSSYVFIHISIAKAYTSDIDMPSLLAMRAQSSYSGFALEKLPRRLTFIPTLP